MSLLQAPLGYRRVHTSMAVGLIIGLVVTRVESQGLRNAPPTPMSPVIDTYHGTTVVDPYRWLEDFENPAVKHWNAAENAYARAFLDSLSGVDELREEVTDILSDERLRYGDVSIHGGRIFCLRFQPPEQQPTIVVMPSWEAADEARVIVNPNTIDESGLTSIDWYRVSPDGSRLAVSLSKAGSELGDLFLYDVDSGQQLPDAIVRVNSGTAGGSMAWMPDGESFYYTRHLDVDPSADDSRVYQHVYFHRLGDSPAADQYELGKGFPEIAEIQLAVEPTSGRVLATVQKGDGGQFAHYLRRQDGQWQQFSEFGDGVVQVVFGGQDNLYAVSLSDAPRGKLLRISTDDLDVSKASVVIPEGDAAIVTGGTAFWGETTVLPTANRLYVIYQLGGPSELRAFQHDGTPLPTPPQLEIASVHGLCHTSDDNVLFGNTSFVEPLAYYVLDAKTNLTTRTTIRNEAPVDFQEAIVERHFARSKDGTRIPLNLIYRRGLERNGNNACVVTGYGGYAISREPSFNALNYSFLKRDVIYVVTNLRGGSEYGEAWHRAGSLTNKQNVFDDFAACLRFLIDHGYTQPQRLGIVGGSNGGLLMGATLVQHPERIRAVVSYVGIYDMLRSELSPNGAFNVTEFGSVKEPEQFEALYSYSPYHNVIDYVPYPAVLFMTGENDPRVDPMQSRKMTARLQAATSSGYPVLLRTSADAGHGLGNSLDERISQSVDMLSFFLHELDVLPVAP